MATPTTTATTSASCDRDSAYNASETTIAMSSFRPAYCACIHTFPFELQFAILCQIQPIQLFTLRRVSHAWNAMLSNPALLEEINQHLPFLTSAPDLTSRMKRRVRMIRKDPVWIKSATEVFLWAREICRNWIYHGGIEHMMRLWKSWVVFLQRPPIPPILVDGLPVTTMKLRIEGLGKRTRAEHPAVEVDIWEDFKRLYPEASQRYLDANISKLQHDSLQNRFYF